MLRPAMSPQLLRIKEAIARHDYRCLGRGGENREGERLIFAYARECGINAPDLMREWQANAKMIAPSRADKPIDDPGPVDDEWPDDPSRPADEDDGDDTEQTETTCPVCRGQGPRPQRAHLLSMQWQWPSSIAG
jgi:hypothetical protein